MKKISNVFYIAVGLIILVVIYGALSPESFEAVTANAKNFVASRFRLVLHVTHVIHGNT